MRACPRCRGLLVERPCAEWEYPRIATARVKPIYLWCCVNCGHRSDAVMELNRVHEGAPSRVRPRRRGPARVRVRPQISWMEMRQMLQARRRRPAPGVLRADEIWRRMQDAVAATGHMA